MAEKYKFKDTAPLKKEKLDKSIFQQMIPLLPELYYIQKVTWKPKIHILSNGPDLISPQ